MQAIVTKYIGPRAVRGSRIKAKCDRGSIMISYPHDKPFAFRHKAAVDALVDKFVAEDEKQGTPREKNVWAQPYVSGGLPGDNGEAHCTAGTDQVVIEFANECDMQQFVLYVRDIAGGSSASPKRNAGLSSALRRAKIGGVR